MDPEKCLRNTNLTCHLMILVVDDTPAFRKIASKVLEYHGYEVITAENGLVALKIATEFNPDLIVMDVRMPIMDGLEATRAIRALGGKMSVIPIIGYSSQDDDPEQKECIKAGMTEFVSKCWGVEHLATRVDDLAHAYKTIH